ncbi:hypothetical protein [Mobiluncus curtisii]|uniref:hypothetical protein n=1 Tax=Mobiluncus curtisii TaxID=2051 RepID=UPI0021E2B407|nr:hypothetical protein [Mobiluncus curtisii]
MIALEIVIERGGVLSLVMEEKPLSHQGSISSTATKLNIIPICKLFVYPVININRKTP